jgi:autotransporter family porin
LKHAVGTPMTGSTINGTVTRTIVVGRRGYQSPLTITSTGVVSPTKYGADGIVDPVSVHNAQINNQGSVSGAYGGFPYSGATGGTGIDFAAVGNLTNSGTISGGDGASTNIRYGTAGAGGIGVDLMAGGSINNSGIINGGEGGYSIGKPGTLGIGGNGVQLEGGILMNSGAITGGACSSRGMSQYGRYDNAGVGVDAQAGASVINTGTLTGGHGGYVYTYSIGSNVGGVGILLDSSSSINVGDISGGIGGPGRGAKVSAGGGGGTGALLLGNSSLLNSRTITGGTGGYGFDSGGAGGTGVALGSGETLTNLGTISGGVGGAGGGGSQFGGSGGYGVFMDGGTLTNVGTLTGGAGVGVDGNGGNGASVMGGLLISSGSIAGGAGGPATYGGVGVFLVGGTLSVSGTISGGAGKTMGDAVYFHGYGATMVIEAGATFNGLVAGGALNKSILALGGTKLGTLTRLGTEFTNFATLTIDAGADWTFKGSNNLGTGTILDTGTLLAKTGSLQAAGLTLDGGSIVVTGDAKLVIGTSTDGAQAGALVVQSGALVEGIGAITGPVFDDGTLAATGNMLTLTGALSGTGTVVVDGSGSTLSLAGPASGVVIDFAGGTIPGTLVLGSLTSVTSTISGFAATNVVDAEKIKASTFTYAAGTLTLISGGQAVGELFLAGDYKRADFALKSDGNGGTDIFFKEAGSSDNLGFAGVPIDTPGKSPADGLSGGAFSEWESAVPGIRELILHHGFFL